MILSFDRNFLLLIVKKKNISKNPYKKKKKLKIKNEKLKLNGKMKKKNS